ncbi:MAG: alpha/beta fold hydrolase [Bacteroidia bacterium]|nr:alpha/beta fold hydrolase [Bacteroidia bacterium]
MTRYKALLILAGAFLLVHCQSKSDGHVTAGVSAAARGNSAALAAARGGEEEVTFTTSDGVRISGTLYTAGSKAPAVLCLHQWRSDRASFAGLARTLQAAGITVLAIDMRGYGGSTRTSGGASVRPDRKARADVEASIAFMRQHASVDPARIGIIGASYGSSNALQYAAADSRIKTLVLLSPGLNYFNELPTEDAARTWGARPLLAVASSEDVRSVETLQAYAKLASGAQTQLYENAGHGTDMLHSARGLDGLIAQHLKKNL